MSKYFSQTSPIEHSTLFTQYSFSLTQYNSTWSNHHRTITVSNCVQHNTESYSNSLNLNFRSSDSNYWIGLRNGSSNALISWTWIDQSPFFNRIGFWGDKFPSGTYACGSISSAATAPQVHGHWEDEHCDKPLRYICKKGKTKRTAIHSHKMCWH